MVLYRKNSIDSLALTRKTVNLSIKKDINFTFGKFAIIDILEAK